MSDIRAKIKAYKKKGCPTVKCTYLAGIPGFKENNVFYLFLDPDNEELEIINYVNEASLPLNRIIDISSITEKEIEEYEKNRIGRGLAATALIGAPGMLFGLSKKKKKKTTFNTFLNVVYQDKDGNENSIIFKPPYDSATSFYFNKFLKNIKPYLPEKEPSGKVEL